MGPEMKLDTETTATRFTATDITVALTFDDVLLVPRHSAVLPSDVDVSTRLTRNITLSAPIISAAMDTVTESRLAIAMAQQGGMGVVHKNQSIEDQASEIDRVKRSESGMIVNPITLAPTGRISEALELMQKYRISGVPITEDGSTEGKLVGILTNRDLRFEGNLNRTICDVMTRDKLITVPVGTTLQEAQTILHTHRVEKLLVVDQDFMLKGLITVKDIQKMITYPTASKDEIGRLRVGGAVGIAKNTVERAEVLVAAGADVLVVDTAHGHSQGVMTMVQQLREYFPSVDLIAGNVATAEGNRGPDRARRRRCEGRYRLWLNLHHADHRRHRHADDLGDRRMRTGRQPPRGPDHRRRGCALFGRHHQSVGGRGEHRDDRQPLRRHGREPRRADSVSGP